MLDHEQQRRLAHLADEVIRDDPRFAAALARGEPRPPREYRRRRRLILLATALPVTIFAVAGNPWSPS